jgi:cytochrome c biogenesis protein
MTDVRAPEADPFESAAEPEESGTRSPARAGAGFGLGDWLKWGWRQLTSMRIALVLLFLLALGSVPGSMLPQQGTDPGSPPSTCCCSPPWWAAWSPGRSG